MGRLYLAGVVYYQSSNASTPPPPPPPSHHRCADAAVRLENPNKLDEHKDNILYRYLCTCVRVCVCVLCRTWPLYSRVTFFSVRSVVTSQ